MILRNKRVDSKLNMVHIKTYISIMKTNIKSLKISMNSKFNKQLKHNKILLAQNKKLESLNHFICNSNMK